MLGFELPWTTAHISTQKYLHDFLIKQVPIEDLGVQIQGVKVQSKIQTSQKLLEYKSIFI